MSEHMTEKNARNVPRTLPSEPKTGTMAALVTDIRALVKPFGGIELELPPRTPMREPPDFGDSEYDP